MLLSRRVLIWSRFIPEPTHGRTVRVVPDDAEVFSWCHLLSWWSSRCPSASGFEARRKKIIGQEYCAAVEYLAERGPHGQDQNVRNAAMNKRDSFGSSRWRCQSMSPRRSRRDRRPQPISSCATRESGRAIRRGRAPSARVTRRAPPRRWHECPGGGAPHRAHARDRRGRPILTPGFIDDHTHFAKAGALLIGANLLDVSTPGPFAARVKAAVRA